MNNDKTVRQNLVCFLHKALAAPSKKAAPVRHDTTVAHPHRLRNRQASLYKEEQEGANFNTDL
jgi:hypothetical protein